LKLPQSDAAAPSRESYRKGEASRFMVTTASAAGDGKRGKQGKIKREGGKEEVQGCRTRQEKGGCWRGRCGQLCSNRE
jgi:hypothetical protein